MAVVNLSDLWRTACGERNGALATPTAGKKQPAKKVGGRRFPIRTERDRTRFLQGMRVGQGGRLGALVVVAARDVPRGEELLSDYDAGLSRYGKDAKGYDWGEK